jgi:hypothetical protein
MRTPIRIVIAVQAAAALCIACQSPVTDVDAWTVFESSQVVVEGVSIGTVTILVPGGSAPGARAEFTATRAIDSLAVRVYQLEPSSSGVDAGNGPGAIVRLGHILPGSTHRLGEFPSPPSNSQIIDFGVILVRLPQLGALGNPFAGEYVGTAAHTSGSGAVFIQNIAGTVDVNGTVLWNNNQFTGTLSQSGDLRGQRDRVPKMNAYTLITTDSLFRIAGDSVVGVTSEVSQSLGQLGVPFRRRYSLLRR